MTALVVLPGEQPGELRWLAEPGTFSVFGSVASFGEQDWPEWLDVAEVRSHRELMLRHVPGRSWAELGDDAWAFVPAAVEESSAWTVLEAGSAGDASDERLCAAVCQVLEGEFGEYVASHGGRIELLDVHDGVVRVRLAGACSSCSIADWTLKLRLERDVRLAAGADFAALETV
ncbi:MAG TPA: NifU family protein [Microbacteriaceae bacterium]|nr:NifU family protein [Microbacteriaceae bacterium]